MTTPRTAIEGPRLICSDCAGKGVKGVGGSRCFACVDSSGEAPVSAPRCNAPGPYPSGCTNVLGHNDAHTFAI